MTITDPEKGDISTRLISSRRRLIILTSDKKITLKDEAIRLEETILEESSSLDPKDEDKKLLVIISFDEAHSRGPEGSIIFLAVRNALRTIVDRAIFTAFLTTTGKIKEFNRPASEESSLRLVDRSFKVFPPFTELGFDQLAPKVDLERYRLSDVASLYFMAKLGRPL